MNQRRLLRAALGLAALTAVTRLTGFGRTAVFGRTVGSGCVGSVYQTANYVPNIVFDIVAGGMLSALVVPILAPALTGGDRDRINHLLSALFNRVLLVLVPIAVIVAVAAEPIMRVLLGAQPDCPGAVSLGTRMLLVFSPQVVLYGIAIVLGGVLTAGERFTWPALAPLLSSLVVIGAYLLYGTLAERGSTVAALSREAELVLSVGTTVGVIVLAGCLIPAVWRTGVRWRPLVKLPDEVARTVRIAATAGAATLAAQEISTAVMIRLANNDTEAGTLVIVTLSQTLFLLPWAVLSLPVATTAFPRLSADWASGQRAGYADRLFRSGTVILLSASLGTALLVAVAQPSGTVLLGPHASALAAFAPTTTAFAIGLIGWSLVALLGRALYASGHIVASAVAQIIGQLSVIVIDVVLSLSVSPDRRGVVLGLGNSVGVIIAAGLLMVAGRRTGVFAAGRWLNRTVVVGLAVAAVAGLLGWLVGREAAGTSTVSALGWAIAAAVVVAVVFAAGMAALDRTGLRILLGRPSTPAGVER